MTIKEVKSTFKNFVYGIFLYLISYRDILHATEAGDRDAAGRELVLVREDQELLPLGEEEDLRRLDLCRLRHRGQERLHQVQLLLLQRGPNQQESQLRIYIW